MTDDFASGLLQAAEDLVAPLSDAVGSPENLNAFLADLGWTSPLTTDAANVFTSFPALFQAIEQAVGQLAQADESGSLTPSEIEDLVTAAISAIAALTQAIEDLTSPKGLGPPFEDSFWAAFPEALVDYLTCRYLAERVPKLYGILVLAGILSEQHVEPDPADADFQFRVPYLQRTVHWDRLPTAVTDPVSLLPAVYGWGTDTFDWELFFLNVGRLLAAFGLQGSLGVPGTELDTYYPSTSFDRQFLRELIVPILTAATDDGTALGVAGLSLHALPIPPTTAAGTLGIPAGFLLSPEVDGELSTGAIQLGEGVSIAVTADFHGSLVQVEVLPSGANALGPTGTVDASATLAVAPDQPLIRDSGRTGAAASSSPRRT